MRPYVGLAVALLFVPLAASAEDDDLRELSLEELLEFEITSVSKKPESLAEAAAAVYVLTGEDIRRAGVTSLPDALRLVPGLTVARIDGSTWAVSSRGFSSTTANKLEVLLDGRSLYTPLFSGVFWDVQDALLQDIDRIEVIRGPGATLWGANAVNGVINILTKSARDAQGTAVALGGGSELSGRIAARHGMLVGESAHLRVYATAVDRDDSELAGGGAVVDRSRMLRAGFRLDRGDPGGARLTLAGDLYQGRARTDNPLRSLGAISPADNELRGGHLLARWSWPLAAGGEHQLQTFYDRTTRDLPGVFAEERDTLDLDYQQRRPLGERHEVVWGLSYRHSSDEVVNTRLLTWTPASRDLETLGAFVQDEVSLADDRFKLTFGSKFEHNDYTGFEIQPSVRWLWRLDEGRVLWGAVSRAVRSPSRLDRDLRFNIPISETPPSSFALLGSDGFESEELLAYEIGFRTRPRPTFSIDLATFYNDYSRLASVEGPGTPFVDGGRLIVPFVYDNRLSGESYGSELAVLWQPAPRWRVHASWTFFELDLTAEAGSSGSDGAEGNDPAHQLAVRSTLDLGDAWSLDAVLRWVDELPSLGADDYLDLDLRLGLELARGVTLSLVGHDLLERRRVEWGSQATAVERGVYGEIRWLF